MRIETLCAAGLLILASCDPPQGVPNPLTGGDIKPQSSTEAAHPGLRSQTIQHFWFDYPFQPQPGSRVWINVGQTNWVEVYPDGSQSRYGLVRQETVDGLSGIVVSKTAGDVQATQTLNDGSFEAFLPDKNSARLVLYFRNKLDGEWQPWRPLAQVSAIE